MIKKTEQEIMSHWKEGDIKSPIISCCCITFNQKDYIEEALDSMLMQETNYAFEIVVHDDVSTDGTREILQKYEEKFPNIIKPIYQTENQWSQGNRVMPIVFQYAIGQYMALCEGDDYWIDKDKLQIQIDEMKKYPECNISFHYGKKKYEDGSHEDEVFCKHANENRFFSTEEVIEYAGPLMPTASICVTKEFTDFIINHDDEFFKKNITGFFIQFFASIKGEARYINKNMCVYRRNGNGSWTQKVADDYNFSLEWKLKSIHSLDIANKLTKNKYETKIKQLVKKYYKDIVFNRKIPLKIRKQYFSKYKKELGFKSILLWNLIYAHPKIHTALGLLKNKVLTK